MNQFTLNNLPADYTPYQKLDVCGNMLIGGVHILAIGEALPIIIGSGDFPKIWVQAPVDVGLSRFSLFVSESSSNFPFVRVEKSSVSLSIWMFSQPLIQMVVQGASSAIVAQIDLRMIGINLHGKDSVLQAGATKIIGNSIQGGSSLVQFSTPSEKPSFKPSRQTR